MRPKISTWGITGTRRADTPHVQTAAYIKSSSASISRFSFLTMFRCFLDFWWFCHCLSDLNDFPHATQYKPCGSSSSSDPPSDSAPPNSLFISASSAANDSCICSRCNRTSSLFSSSSALDDRECRCRFAQHQIRPHEWRQRYETKSMEGSSPRVDGAASGCGCNLGWWA